MKCFSMTSMIVVIDGDGESEGDGCAGNDNNDNYVDSPTLMFRSKYGACTCVNN